MKLKIEPLTPERWDDLVDLFSLPGRRVRLSAGARKCA